MSKWIKIYLILGLTAIISMALPWWCPEALGKTPKSKFYDFNDQILPIGATYWVKMAEEILKPN